MVGCGVQFGEVPALLLGQGFLYTFSSQDLRGSTRKVPNHVDLAGMSRQLLRELRTVQAGDDDELLLHPQAVMYYTEHSPRNVLVSLTAALGVPKDRRGYFGRWSPSESDDYLRSMRFVSVLQGLVTRSIADGDGRARQPDSDCGLEAHLRERGVPEGEIVRQRARLHLVRPEPASSTYPSFDQCCCCAGVVYTSFGHCGAGRRGAGGGRYPFD